MPPTHAADHREDGGARPTGRRWRWMAVLALLVAAGVAAVALEMRTSRLQAWFFSARAGAITTTMGAGPSPAIRLPEQGPYDIRYGYSEVSNLIAALTRQGFVVDSQARVSDGFVRLLDRGLSPIYRAKDRAGLIVLDRRDSVMFDGTYPARWYPEFDSIPDLVWRTLLFVEDRELLDSPSAYHNPAVNWPRLLRAATGLGGRRLGLAGPVAGGSTLATQIEKFRHAPEGRTLTPGDKLLQMESASWRAYLDGPETLEARRRIVTSYLNSAPFAGIAGFGEVTGLGDALWAWYGADFPEVNALLREAFASPGAVTPDRHGRAFRQVLHLLLSVQRPSYFLADSAGAASLARRADRFLELLPGAGVISPELRDATRSPVAVRHRAPDMPSPSFVTRKATNAARTELLTTSRLAGLPVLDRIDATARTSFDGRAQAAATAILTHLSDPATVTALGLDAPRLLARGDPAQVHYAFLLYERTPRGNVVRVQADNVEAPFSPIEGAKLELGSTAKLRTLVTYLEAVERAYHELRADSAAAEPRPRALDDPLTRWVREHAASHPGDALRQVLDAAMRRRYSASPQERFYTGGGLHRFGNFESVHDGQVLTVQEAFRHSVNLPFIRMMRDVVQFQIARLPGYPAQALLDRADPRRREYLERFADREGRQFLDQFLRKHRWSTLEGALAAVVRDRVLSRSRLAWTFRSVAREGTLEEFQELAAAASSEAAIQPARLRALYERADPVGVSLVDRGFLAGIHPLELWLVEFRLRHPEARRAEIMDSSRAARREVYQWLFSTRRSEAQDQRIRSILEVEAFFEIHRAWQRLGYPFGSLVPSLATAIGSSADRPDQLAELVGILLNEGVRRPAFRVESVRLATETPYETLLGRPAATGERVLSPEIAAVVLDTMADVVEQGTGRRAAGAVRGPDGRPLRIGAKTGTGNNRFRVYGPGGRVVEDRAINRTSTVVFYVGDRLFGTLTAYVPGPEADGYDFTSSLPAQILRLLGPALGDLAAAADAGELP